MKHFLAILLLFLCSTLFAQSDKLMPDVYTYPPHAVGGDSVYVVTEVLLPKGSINLGASWVMDDSLLTVVACYSPARDVDYVHFLDTLLVGPLPKGDYFLKFVAYSSMPGPECIPTDSVMTTILFEVGKDFEFEEEPGQYSSTIMIPNPSPDGISELIHAETVERVDVFAPNGQLVKTIEGKRENRLEVNLLKKPAGDYRLRIVMQDGSLVYRRLIRH